VTGIHPIRIGMARLSLQIYFSDLSYLDLELRNKEERESFLPTPDKDLETV
jgi:hypothetical protein